MKSLLKRLIFSLIGSRFFSNIRYHQLSNKKLLTILSLHRVDNSHRSAYEAIDPQVFDELVRWLSIRFHIITFSEISQSHLDKKKPLLILSFDDGYKDFIEIIVPILRKYAVGANQNIIPACVNTSLPPMNVVLQDFIGTAPATLLSEINIPEFMGVISPDDRIKSGIRVSAILKNKSITEQKILNKRLQKYFNRFDNFKTTPMMTVDDITELFDEYEFGVHSFEYATMNVETDAYMLSDSEQCKLWFEENLRAKVNIYAFPNGAARASQIEIAKNQGYKHILLVGEKFSTIEMHYYKRFTMYANTIQEARFRALGGYTPVKNHKLP